MFTFCGAQWVFCEYTVYYGSVLISRLLANISFWYFGSDSCLVSMNTLKYQYLHTYSLFYWVIAGNFGRLFPC